MTPRTTPADIHTIHQEDQMWFRAVDVSRAFNFMSPTHIKKHTSPRNIMKDAHGVNYVNLEGLRQVASTEFKASRLKKAADDLWEWTKDLYPTDTDIYYSGAALDDGSEGYIAGKMTDEEKSKAEQIAENRYGFGITADFGNQETQHYNPKENMTTAAPATPSTDTVQIFDFEGHNVRTVLIDSDPWFVLSDLAKVMEIKNIGDLKKRLDQAKVGQTDVTDSIGRQRKTVIVNEANMYRVIMRSDKPEAIKFQNWVTDEVIPAIRKHGGYLTPEAIEETITSPDFIIKLAQNLKDEQIQRKQAELKARGWENRAMMADAKATILEEEKRELTPKADAFDKFINGEGVYLMGTVAKMLGTGQNRLFKALREDKILITGGKRYNTPYQGYMKHFAVKATTFWDDKLEDYRATYTTYVKPSGVDFIARRLGL